MKYAGSKSRFAKELVPIIQSYIDANTVGYLEPFVGGANIIDKIKCKKKIGSDNNQYLISLWNAIKNGIEFPNGITREEWRSAKYNKDQYDEWYIGLCGIVASYNGEWFTGYGATATTKNGGVRDYYKEGIRNILKQANYIKDVEFVTCDYSKYEGLKNYVIYCDAPYTQGKNRYKDGNIFNHDNYYEWIREIGKNNIVLCSEYWMPDDFECIWERFANKTHPSQVDGTVEKLFIHKDCKQNIKSKGGILC